MYKLPGMTRPNRVAPVSFERNMEFLPTCRSLTHGMPPHPHPGQRPSAPPPPQNVMSPAFYPCWDSNFSLLNLAPERLLERLTVWVLDVTILTVGAAGQLHPLPVGMASEGGKPVGWVGCVRVPEILGTQR